MISLPCSCIRYSRWRLSAHVWEPDLPLVSIEITGETVECPSTGLAQKMNGLNTDKSGNGVAVNQWTSGTSDLGGCSTET